MSIYILMVLVYISGSQLVILGPFGSYISDILHKRFLHDNNSKKITVMNRNEISLWL